MLVVAWSYSSPLGSVEPSASLVPLDTCSPFELLFPAPVNFAFVAFGEIDDLLYKYHT
ncbi:unnamed protein product [Pneumocystis jirovecii]|uniref:Uncharacterized protein n=1 Tax=Pneumocystis jirovecii TaxID=42068 RepID=L0P7G2_PNEJI|nr:unnamed protein product [Pneumocystis jirovecii]